MKINTDKGKTIFITIFDKIKKTSVKEISDKNELKNVKRTTERIFFYLLKLASGKVPNKEYFKYQNLRNLLQENGQNFT